MKGIVYLKEMTDIRQRRRTAVYARNAARQFSIDSVIHQEFKELASNSETQTNQRYDKIRRMPAGSPYDLSR
jgi:hypothetical protein